MPFTRRSKLILCTVGAVITTVAVVAKKDALREYASSLCQSLSEDPPIEADVVRDGFDTLPVAQVASTPGHTHPTAASLRSSATAFACSLANYCGADIYSVQMSKSDQRKDMRGSRQWCWAKDVKADNRKDKPLPSDIRYLCDVDYYIDMPALLVQEAKPILLYTVVPEEAVSQATDDTSFRFSEDGTLQTIVSGSGEYRHYLWNYGHDSILAIKWRMGLPILVVPYAVERKQVGKHRQVILLTPIRVFRGIAAVLAYFLLEPRPLTRWNPIVEKSGEKFVRFDVHKSTGTAVTTARPGTWLCATVPADADASIATVARLGTTNLMLPTSASWLANDRPAAAVLTEYHRLCGLPSRMVVFPVEHSVRAYQYKPPEFDCEVRPKLEAFMSPFVHGAFAPVMNKAGEEQSVEGRINSLKKPEPKPSRFVEQCMSDFADLILQGIILEPVCYDVVESKQKRAAQQLSLNKAVLVGQFRALVLKCFGKAEAYQDVKDPRNISQYNDADKLDMAMFALALSEHCKQFAWYGPGKTPLEVARRVAEVCQGAKEFLNVSDYKRMDGTITYYLRRLDRVVFMKAFVHHRAKVNDILKTNVDNLGILPHGTRFNQGPTHGSGCSSTSVTQTLRAAFTAFLGFRNLVLPGGRRMSAQEAFEALGIHLGDDGIDADLPVSCHGWAARRVGLVLEAATVQRGDRGVNFLARYYSPEVWQGSPDSMCDVKRQLSKFHTTVRLPANVTPEQKLVEKCMSYVATDANTPVIGAFCKRVLLFSSYRPKSLFGLGNWWSKFDDSVQYPNQNVGGWMDVELATQFEEFDRGMFEGWLASTETAEDLLRAPLCAEPRAAKPTSVDVVVDNDVMLAETVEPRPTPEEPKGKPSTRRRRKHRKQNYQDSEDDAPSRKEKSPGGRNSKL